MKSRVLLPVVVGLAMGLALVWALRSGSGADDIASLPVAEASPAVNGMPMALPDGISPEEVRVIELPGLVAAAGSDAAEGGADATGSLVLHVVWGDDGAPAVGVGVVVRSSVLPSPVRQRVAITDAEGVAFLDGLPAGGVTATGDRGGTISAKVVVHEETQATLELPVGPWVHGVVLDPDGQPVAGADIWMSAARTTGEGLVVAQSARDGGFALRSVERWHFLEARGAGWGPSGVSRVPDTEAARVDVTLRMTRRFGDVTVRVETRDGAPIPEATVQLGGERDRAWTLQPDDSSTELARSVPARREVTDEDGVVRIMGVPPGAAALLVRAPGYASSGEDEVVVVKEGELTKALVTLDPGSRLAGRVLAIASDGTALVGVSGAVVTAIPQDSMIQPGDFLATAVTSGEDGEWAVDEFAAGEVLLTARHDVSGEASRTVYVAAGGTLEGIDLGLRRGLEIRGLLVDEQGAPLPMWIIKAKREDVYAVWEGEAVTDASGAFAIPNCTPVRHTLRVLEPQAGNAAPVLVFKGAIPDGEPVTLVVRADSRSSAQILFALVDPAGLPVTGAGVSVSSTDRQTAGRVIETSVPGSYRTELLPPGAYELRVWPGLYPLLLLEDLSLAPNDRLDLGVLTLGAGGRFLMNLVLPPGLEDTQTWVSVMSETKPWLGNVQQTSAGWLSALLEPGIYVVSARGSGLATQIRSVDVRIGETTKLSVAMERGVYCLLELHGLSHSTTAADSDERFFGNRFLRLEVDDDQGRPVARQSEGMDQAIQLDTPMRMLVQLRPGRYAARVLVGGVIIAETDFEVLAGLDHPSQTRLDVER